MTPCLSCLRGFHYECNNPCCCRGSSPSVDTGEAILFSSTERFSKEDVSVSAGRKRAAVLYQVNPDAPCEWRALTNCGGGKNPIDGCLTGKQQHRHHGPVKRTTRNERSNIHLICTKCHNTWHAKNDPLYGEKKGDEEDFEILPHEPREMDMNTLLKVAGSIKE